jgi:competence protein ComEC
MRVFLFASSITLGAWWLQQQADLPPLDYVLIVIPLGVFAWMSRKLRSPAGRFATTLCWLLICVLIGFYWAAGHARIRLASNLGDAWQGRDVRVEGVIAKMTQPGERGTRFVMEVERVLTVGARVPRRISLTWYASWSGDRSHIPELVAGQRWQLTVRLKPPHGNFNPHTFDSEARMLERGIRARGYVRDAPSAKRLSPMVWQPLYIVERARERIRRNLQRLTDDQAYAGILVALAIGDQHAISPQQWTVFTQTGVNHLMSISGLHITMVSGLVFAVMLRVWRRTAFLAARASPLRAATLAGLLIAVVYAALSGFAIPAQRTVYMLCVVALALWSGWRWPAPAILGAALLLVVTLDPMAVISAGFWLSFGAVATILFIGTADSSGSGWLWTWLRMQWAITIALTPLLLVLFQKVSVVSPFANAIAIPVVSLCVAPLALSLVVLPFEPVAMLAHEVMRYCFVGLEYLATLPGAVWQQHAPLPWTVVLAIGGVVMLLLPRGFPAKWIGLILLIPMFAVVPKGPKAGELWLTVLDVGQGLSVVARTAHHAVLFDTGPDYRGWGDAGRFIIVPYLRGEGIVTLDKVVVSHDDLDHSGGTGSVLESIPAALLLTSIGKDVRIGGGVTRARCEVGQQWTLDDVTFEVLHPRSESYGITTVRDNDRSCVVRIESQFGSALLPADIERRSERQLVESRPASLDVDVLVAPHHGSRTSSGKHFIAAVTPQIVVFPVGYANRYGHPHPQVESRYRKAGAQLMSTDRQGAITLKFSANGVEASAWRDVKRRYWHERVKQNK